MFDFLKKIINKKSKPRNKTKKYNGDILDLNLDYNQIDYDYLVKNNFFVYSNDFENEDVILSHSPNLSYAFTKQIDQIKSNNLKFPEYEFDVVIAGGGLKGFYNIGACEVLKKMELSGQIKIRYFTGVSSGAYVSVFTILNIPIKIIRNMYEFAKKNKHRHDLNKIFCKICEHILPCNAHELCNGKLRILVSKFTLKGLVPVIIDRFDSKEHLIKILHATSFIPFLTSTEVSGVKIGSSQYFDGAFTNNTPIIFEHDLPQLVFNTPYVNYSNSYAFNIIDSNPEHLILSGAYDMEKFLLQSNYNQDKIDLNPIKWIPSKTNFSHNKDLDIVTNLILNILIIVTLIYGQITNLLNNKIILFIKNVFFNK